jgi:16S rRNA (guanine527-N7)-methyltransferase
VRAPAAGDHVTDGPARVTPGRAPLPTTLDALPGIDAAYEEALDGVLAELGLDPPVAVRAALQVHARALLAWNAAINLTAIREPAEVAILHVADSLSALPALASGSPPRPALLDIGSGSGFPGLAVGVGLPAGRLALVDSVAKKARFLSAAASLVIESMGSAGAPAPDVEIHAERVEDLAGEPGHREAYDVVTVRAVGTLAEVAELGLPLLRPGGSLVAWKRERRDAAGGLANELRDAGRIIREAGGGRPVVIAPPSAMLETHRLVVVRKVRTTPAWLPRPPAARRSSRRPGA